MKKLIKILSHIIFMITINSNVAYSQYENLIKFNGDNWTYGYKDSNDKIIVHPIYNSASLFNKGLALVGTAFGSTIINNKGEELAKFGGEPGTIYADLDYNLIRHKVNDKWGYINRKGELVIDYQYSNCMDFNEGLAPVQINNEWGYIDSQNNIVISPKYENVDLFYNGLAAISISGRWGFIDTKGNLKLPAIYGCVHHFSEDLCAVNSFSHNIANYFCEYYTDVINKNGKIVFSGYFASFNAFKNGIANYWESAELRGQHIFINRQGAILRTE